MRYEVGKSKTLERLAKIDPNAALKMPKNLYEKYKQSLKIMHRQHTFGKKASLFNDEGYNHQSPTSQKSSFKIESDMASRKLLSHRNSIANKTKKKPTQNKSLTKNMILGDDTQYDEISFEKTNDINVVFKK